MEPLTLTVLGAEALKQGIQFLYAQAGEVLKRWRERRDGESADSIVPVVNTASAVLDIAPDHLQVDFGALDKLEPEIRSLRTALMDYATGVETVAPDPELLKLTDGLRCSLEAVAGQRLTLRGEDRPDADPDIDVSIHAGEVAGEVAGIVADYLEGLRIRASINVNKVEQTGTVIGVKGTSGLGKPSPSSKLD